MAFTPPARSRGAEAEPRVCGGEIWGDLLWGQHFRSSGETSSLGSAYGDLHVPVTGARTSTKMVQPVTHLVTHTYTHIHEYTNIFTHSQYILTHILTLYMDMHNALTFTQCYMHANPHIHSYSITFTNISHANSHFHTLTYIFICPHMNAHTHI